MGHRPFLLDPRLAHTPTRFEVHFVADAVRYHYGLRYDAQRVVEEWLYAFPSNTRQVWFHRNAEQEDEYYFGSHLKGRKKTLAELTRPNALFLSAAAQNNHDQLSAVYRWFARGVESHIEPHLAGSQRFHPRSILLELEQEQTIRRLLREADLGVVDFRTTEDEGLAEGLRTLSSDSSIPAPVRQEFDRMLKDPPMIIELAHQGASGHPVFLPIDLESHGTQLLLAHSERVLVALREGSVLVLDELDAGMHSRLCAALVRLFTHPESNPNGAQLLFTTHDETLLDHVRRDSVWFVEKGRSGGSVLVPLSDFKTRKRDDIRRAYHQGRFGGVPMVGDLMDVVVGSVKG